MPDLPAIDFQALFENAPSCNLVLSPDLRIIAVTDAYAAATRTVRAEILGRGIFEVFPDNPEDRGADGVRNLRRSLERVLRDHRPDHMARQRYDIPIPGSDGKAFEKRYWDPLNLPIFDAAGRLQAILHHATDVTALVEQTEERQQLRTIVETSHEASISHTRSGGIIGLNPAAERLLGRTAAELMERAMDDFLEPEDRTEDRLRRQRVIDGRQSEYWESSLLAADGRRVPIAGIIARVCGLDGETIGFVRSFHDLTRWRQAELELDRIFALSLDILCISSSDGYFKRISPAVTRVLGWEVGEFLARPYLESIHPDDIGMTVQAVEQQVKRGEPVHLFENRFRHRDGSWRLLSWTSVPQPGGLMYAVARDVTRQREAEADIVRLNGELGERTRQLEANNRELEAFSYSVSHDLRAPLRSIAGFSQALLEDHAATLGDDGKRLLDRVVGNARHMGLLIDELLNFAKVSRQDLRCEPCDMTLLARRAFEAIEPSARAHVACFALDQLPPVTGDPVLLGQVWINLIGNAVKFTRAAAAAEIHISAEIADSMATYRIADNGAGFDPLYASKLFGIFERLHGKDQFEGTGVGLSLVQRIVQRHGGGIRAEGKPGHGATFFMSLPMAPAKQAGTPGDRCG